MFRLCYHMSAVFDDGMIVALTLSDIYSNYIHKGLNMTIV